MLRNSVSKRNLISISLGLLAMAAMGLALMPRAAQADEEAPFKGTLTVAFVFLTTDACALGDAKCLACAPGFYIEAQGIGDTSKLGTLFFEVQKCRDASFSNYNGTFTMTAPNGMDSLTGTYKGQNDPTEDLYNFGPFSGELTITGGTGKFDGAQGTASFTAVASPNNMAFYSVQGKLRGGD